MVPSLLRLSTVIREKAKNKSVFAKALGLTPSALTKSFQANRPVTQMQALAIESVYGISHQWLLDGEGPKDANVAKLMSLNLAPSSTPPCESKPTGGRPPLPPEGRPPLHHRTAILVTSDHNGAYNTKEVETSTVKPTGATRPMALSFLGIRQWI